MKLYRYRIFTNDRRSVKGVPMYSCFQEVQARTRREALMHCPPEFDWPSVGVAGPMAPAHAIRWPESEQSLVEKAWLQKHV